MPNKFVYESFDNFLNYKLLMETATAEDINRLGLNEADVKSDPWSFKFESGKFKKSDVGEVGAKNLEEDFKNRIVPALNNPAYIGQKLVVNLSSASSKVPVNPSGDVAKELKGLGYSPDNAGLCKARGNTVVGLIKDMLYKSYGGDMNESEFFKIMENKVTFANKPNPNIGPEYSKSKGDDADDQKYKDNQYISATLEVTGEKIKDEDRIGCNMKKKSFKGGKADASNGYAGYDKTVYLSAKSGQKMKIMFDPFTVPDSILFSYTGAAPKLSPFMGAVGAKFIRGEYTKALEDSWNERVNKGEAATAKKEVIGGKSYLVIDYKDYLNNVINKGGALVKAIEAKLKTLGLKPIKDICPEFFDSNGKIEVYATKDKSELNVAKDLVNDPSAITIQLLKSGALAQSPKIDNKVLEIPITKNITRDRVTLVAFSPVAGTSFGISSEC